VSASGDDDGGILIAPTAGGTLPSWVFSLRPLAPVAGALASVASVLIAFGKDPIGFVVRIVNFYIVGGVLAVGRYAIGVVVAPFEIFGGALDFIQGALVGIFGGAGAGILSALVGIQQSVAGLIAGAGPLGPPIAVGAAAIGFYVLYRVGIAALELVPGGGALKSLLGVGP
jgi:hypothetical protein